MKKVLLGIFVLFAVALPSFATISPEESMSADYIKSHGYSDEMVKLIDLNHAQVTGEQPTYKKNEPDWYTSNKFYRFVRHAFIYLDCGLDDEKFMKDNIDMRNRWDNI